jgi:hypothetical protein
MTTKPVPARFPSTEAVQAERALIVTAAYLPGRSTRSARTRAGQPGMLFCWEDGRPPRTDTARDDSRSSPRRREAKIDWKALSRRIGHADVAFTMKQCVRTDL